MSDPVEFEEYNPPGVPQIWTFVRGDKEFLIYCNDEIMLRYDYPESCESQYEQDAVAVYFLVEDTVSQYYRKGGESDLIVIVTCSIYLYS